MRETTNPPAQFEFQLPGAYVLFAYNTSLPRAQCKHSVEGELKGHKIQDIHPPRAVKQQFAGCYWATAALLVYYQRLVGHRLRPNDEGFFHFFADCSHTQGPVTLGLVGLVRGQ